MKTKPLSLFFLGKGGVGKSTSSALTALAGAQKGASVLLVSLDPAHNQSDIFEIRLSDKPKKIKRNLYVSELNLEKWIRKYLRGVEEQVKRSYKYLTALNLEHYLNIIKYSPGIEEYALLNAYEHILKKHKDKEYIIFDMPPTALTLKFFELPQISLVWLKNLLNLRKEILKKRDIISTVKVGKTKIQSDKILSRLEEQISRYEHIKAVFSDTRKTRIHLVLNPDKLSRNESVLIEKRLRDNALTINRLFLNKFNQENCTDIQNSFPEIPLIKLPLSEHPLLGSDRLTAYLTAKNTDIQNIL